MKKTIIGIVIGIILGVGLLALILAIRQNYMVSKYIEVKNNYNRIEEYETIMTANKNLLNNYNNESNNVSLECVNSIKKFIDESEKTYFIGETGLKEEKTAYFNSYSNNINLLYGNIKNACALNEKVTNVATLLISENNLIISKDYSDYVTNYKEKAILIPKEPTTNQKTRNILKKTEAQVVQLIVNELFS